MLIYKCDRCETHFKHLVAGPVTHFAGKGLVSKDKPDYAEGLTISITGALPGCIYLHKQLCSNCGKDLLIWLKQKGLKEKKVK